MWDAGGVGGRTPPERYRDTPTKLDAFTVTAYRVEEPAGLPRSRHGPIAPGMAPTVHVGCPQAWCDGGDINTALLKGYCGRCGHAISRVSLVVAAGEL